MRSLLGLSFFLVVGCSNACPPPVLCTNPYPDHCPCIIGPAADTGPVDHPDAFVEAVDANLDANVDDGGIDASQAIDANVDAAADGG